MKAKGGSTSALHSHMHLIHGVNTLKRHAPVVDISQVEIDVNCPSPKANKITEYFQKGEESLHVIISRMAALDGIPFKTFCTSEDLRKCLSSRCSTKIPTSPNTIRQYVLDYAKEVRTNMIKEFGRLKSGGQKFSLTGDEWTSVRNRRYLNVNVHSYESTWNILLSRAKGKLPAEKVGCDLSSHKF